MMFDTDPEREDHCCINLPRTQLVTEIEPARSDATEHIRADSRVPPRIIEKIGVQECDAAAPVILGLREVLKLG